MTKIYCPRKKELVIIENECQFKICPKVIKIVRKVFNEKEEEIGTGSVFKHNCDKYNRYKIIKDDKDEYDREYREQIKELQKPET